MNIGIVEDDALIGSMLAEMLECFGHVPTVYNDGWTFLEAFTSSNQSISSKLFDVVILDMLLPGRISGLEVISYLHLTHPHLPLVVVSAISSADLESIREQFPGIKVLRKPFRLQDLRVSIEA